MVEPAFSAATEGPEGALPEPPTGGVEGTRAEPQVVGAEGPQEEPTTANAEGPQGEEVPSTRRCSRQQRTSRVVRDGARPGCAVEEDAPSALTPAWPRAEASSNLACTATEPSVAEIEEIPHA